jgi:hypothetical protein
LRVIELEQQAIKEGNRARQERFRERKRNARNVSNVGNVTVVTPTALKEEEENKKERRKKASAARKSALLAGWTLPEEGIAFARSKGWPEDRISTEALRFRDHAHANGRLQVDWAAAWRSWVTSPYRQSSNQNGGPIDGREQRLQDRNRRINAWEAALDKLGRYGEEDLHGSGQAAAGKLSTEGGG